MVSFDAHVELTAVTPFFTFSARALFLAVQEASGSLRSTLLGLQWLWSVVESMVTTSPRSGSRRLRQSVTTAKQACTRSWYSFDRRLMNRLKVLL